MFYPEKVDPSLLRPNTDELAREWGLLDGLCRSNILKMIVN
jgi:hypothetical protein